MTRAVTIAVLLLALAAPAMAVDPPHCLKPAEVLIEQSVRHGIFLRESADHCDGMVPGSTLLWREFNKAFGDRLKKQTDAHNKWIQRQFGDDWKQAADFYDGRQVTTHRNYPINQIYCDDIKKLLDANKAKGWASFTRQAKVLQDDVALDFKLCAARR